VCALARGARVEQDAIVQDFGFRGMPMREARCNTGDFLSQQHRYTTSKNSAN